VGAVWLPVEALAEVPGQQIGVAGAQHPGDLQDRPAEYPRLRTQDLAELGPEVRVQAPPAGGGERLFVDRHRILS
jgi:hypothetical protein